MPKKNARARAPASNESALNFVAGAARIDDLTPEDSDFASWVMMSGDLLGSSSGQHYPGADYMGAMEMPFMGGAHSHDMYRGAAHHHGGMYPPVSEAHSFQVPVSSMPPPGAKPAGGAKRKSAASKDDSDGSDDDDDDDEESKTTGGNPSDPATKRQLRLEKNREIARNCRKRKREKYQKIEDELQKLRNYNAQLEKQLNKNRDGRDREAARKAELQHMSKMLENKCSENDMKVPLAHYKEMYSDFGRERNAAIQFHMSQLKSLLIPNTVSKMTMWSLQQEDEFYDEKKNQKTFGGGIWNMLSSELRFTEEQKKTLMDMRHGIRAQRKNVAECLRILKELETRVGSNFESMGRQMDMVMNTITNTQQARFLLWIEQNKACTFMLNNMWNKNPEEDEAPSVPNTDDEFDDSASASTLRGSESGSTITAAAGGSSKVKAEK